MTIKRFLTYTTTLFTLRRISLAQLRQGFVIPLLLAALTLGINQQAQAQTIVLPDAFETKTPTIGDGQYYYIQFYYNGLISYLTDRGVEKRASVADFLPSNNRLWTLVDAGDGDDSHFKLKNKAGHYIGLLNKPENSSGYRYVCLESGHASIATFTLQTDGDGYNLGYNLFDVYNNCLLGRPNNTEWTAELSKIRVDASGRQNSRMHFVQLKSNAAFIIYYREEGTDNDHPNVNATRHYLTYSGTDDTRLNGTQDWWHSDVSSQQSIIPSNMPLRNLPTLAAYHKDGLWMVEKADVEGQFYIKRYSDGKYLNKHNHNGL